MAINLFLGFSDYIVWK